QGAGCLIGIHFGQPVAPIVVGLRKRGILVGGSADPQIMRLMPPAVVSAEEIDLFFTHLDDVLEEVKA
ncbi:MAG TPA: aspartate aminotransferase family protein, partial [Bacteroidetes bacterium]|nr:aspartate aminotransferase family protein [Bacteroidota bacterium]